MKIPGSSGLPLLGLLRALQHKWHADAVTNWAAQFSYYFMFAVFPLLLFLVTLAAYLPLHSAVDVGLARLNDLMPGPAMKIIEDEVHGLFYRPRPKLLTAGLVLSLWSASRGIDTLRQALNLVYGVREGRTIWRTQAVALMVTLLGPALLLVGVAAIVLGGRVGGWAAAHLGVDQFYLHLWAWLRWPTTGMIVMLGAALAYWLLPDVKARFRYITPGSVVATLLWLGATAGFTAYTEHFGSYNAAYGSLAGVALLMLWMYLSGLSLVLGAELNATLEHADQTLPNPPVVATRSAPEGKGQWQLSRRRPV